MIISTDAEKLFNKTQHPACGYLMLMCGRNWHSVVEQLSFIKKTNRKKKTTTPIHDKKNSQYNGIEGTYFNIIKVIYDKLTANQHEEFSGSPLVRTPCPHYQGPGLNPWSVKIPQAVGPKNK